MSTFVGNYTEDVSKYVEKKGGLDYLSWGYAQKKARELDESFEWELVPLENGKLVHDGMVKVRMVFLGKEYRHYFPILDYRNKAIANPNGFDINTAQMRGMAKLFAMVSGYGLSLYTGEDIRNLDDAGKQSEVDSELMAVKKDFNKYYLAMKESSDSKKQQMLEEFRAHDIVIGDVLDKDRLSQLPINKLKMLTIQLGNILNREED
jgi:Protein of unknown function (DUF1071).